MVLLAGGEPVSFPNGFRQAVTPCRLQDDTHSRTQVDTVTNRNKQWTRLPPGSHDFSDQLAAIP